MYCQDKDCKKNIKGICNENPRKISIDLEKNYCTGREYEDKENNKENQC